MQAAAITGRKPETQRHQGIASRVNISPTEDPMARGCSYGTGSIRPSSHDFASQVSGHLRFAPVHILMRLVSSVTWLIVAGCIAASLSSPLVAQDDSPDVHITPRVQHDKPEGPPATTDAKEALKDAKPYTAPEDISLKTHTKPFRKDVDLVLVPVSVTDPITGW